MDNAPAVDLKDPTGSVSPVTPESDKKPIEIEVPLSGEELVKKLTSETPKEEVAPVPLEDQVTLKTRLNGAISEVEKKNEEVRRATQLQTEMVAENPDLIHKIAASDPVLANKIVEKVWGTRGVRSYKQLLDLAKLEEMKDTDPQLYETKREMNQIKADLAAARDREQGRIKGEFFTSKGILENDYDPNYVKFQAALETVNPSILDQDPKKAYDIAFKVAFSGVENVPVKEILPTLSIGGGTPPSPIPASKPNVSDQTSWLADSLNKLHGYNIQFTS